ncbi:MAG: hypothetical protein LUH50_12155 [Bacteroides intestinalis]|nr:hypothetical protein [Bacteroides intestinalis]
MSYNKLNSLQANTKAIRIAFKVRKEQRKATLEERAVLQQFTGFGGVSYILSLDGRNTTEKSEINKALQQLSSVLLNGVDGDQKL